MAETCDRCGSDFLTALVVLNDDPPACLGKDRLTGRLCYGCRTKVTHEVIGE